MEKESYSPSNRSVNIMHSEREILPSLSKNEIESQTDNSEQEASSCQYHIHYSEWNSNCHHLLYGDAITRDTIYHVPGRQGERQRLK